MRYFFFFTVVVVYAFLYRHFKLKMSFHHLWNPEASGQLCATTQWSVSKKRWAWRPALNCSDEQVYRKGHYGTANRVSIYLRAMMNLKCTNAKIEENLRDSNFLLFSVAYFCSSQCPRILYTHDSNIINLSDIQKKVRKVFFFFFSTMNNASLNFCKNFLKNTCQVKGASSLEKKRHKRIHK